MLKKLLHIILSAILLATTTGFSVKMHYCLGEYQNSSLAWLDVGCCDVEVPPLGCCDDTVAHFQLNDAFQVSAKQQLPDISLDLALPPIISHYPVVEAMFQHLQLKTKFPPPKMLDIPVLFQTFLI